MSSSRTGVSRDHAASIGNSNKCLWGGQKIRQQPPLCWGQGTEWKYQSTGLTSCRALKVPKPMNSFFSSRTMHKCHLKTEGSESATQRVSPAMPSRKGTCNKSHQVEGFLKGAYYEGRWFRADRETRACSYQQPRYEIPSALRLLKQTCEWIPCCALLVCVWLLPY